MTRHEFAKITVTLIARSVIMFFLIGTIGSVVFAAYVSTREMGWTAALFWSVWAASALPVIRGFERLAKDCEGDGK